MDRLKVKSKLASPFAPGEAYEQARDAVKRGEIDKARELLPFMLKSDRGLIEQRITEKEQNK